MWQDDKDCFLSNKNCINRIFLSFFCVRFFLRGIFLLAHFFGGIECGIIGCCGWLAEFGVFLWGTVYFWKILYVQQS
jgi:hypothetical protein